MLKESGTGLCIETGGKSMDPTSPVLSPLSGAKAMSSIKSSQQSYQIRAHLNQIPRKGTDEKLRSTRMYNATAQSSAVSPHPTHNENDSEKSLSFNKLQRRPI